jgi:hypothetical protein
MKLIYTVVVEFHDKVVDDNEVNEVAENILTGLVDQVNTSGLAPEESETFTKSIEVAKDGVIVASKTF